VTSFGDHQSSVEFNREGDFASSRGGDAGVEAADFTYTFMLLEERYLEDMDTRCIIQFDDEKFVASVWERSEIFVIDREKPDAVNSFETMGSQPACKRNLSI